MNRNYLVFVMMTGLIALNLSGCKYPEGPALSLQSPEARISQTWEVIEAIDKDGNDVTANFDNKFTFEEDGDVSATIEVVGFATDFEGSWDLDNDKREFELDLRDEVTGLVPYERTYDIQRLTSQEFWLLDQNDSTQFKLEVN